MIKRNTFKAVAIGASSGGLKALSSIFRRIPPSFALPVIVVQHLLASEDHSLIEYFESRAAIPVSEARDKENIAPGRIYFAPPDYHLLSERDFSFSLSKDDRVNYSRPSIDVFFETAARAWKNELLGVILTGSNSDGAAGIRAIHEMGGMTIAQDPAEAEGNKMPESAIETGCVDSIMSIENIGIFVAGLSPV